jgi:cytidine deaminase
MDNITKQKLIETAKQALDNAYCIVSNFPVGAAVLTSKGNIYKGCNTESVISGMGVCAERSAIDHAVANGEYRYVAIAVTSNKEEPIRPCGMCRQYIGEFAQVSEKNIKIIMLGSNGSSVESSINELYPDSFGPADLGINLDKYRK